MTEATPKKTRGNQTKMSSNDENDENAQIEASNDNGGVDNIAAAAPAPVCETCGSTENCEEDEDNPGEYYCGSCWEEYDVTMSQKELQPTKAAAEENGSTSPGSTNNANVENSSGDVIIVPLRPRNRDKLEMIDLTDDVDESGRSNSTSPFATPRGLSLNTQEETEASLPMTQEEAQSQETRGGMSSTASQEPATSEDRRPPQDRRPMRPQRSGEDDDLEEEEGGDVVPHGMVYQDDDDVGGGVAAVRSEGETGPSGVAAKKSDGDDARAENADGDGGDVATNCGDDGTSDGVENGTMASEAEGLNGAGDEGDRGVEDVEFEFEGGRNVANVEEGDERSQISDEGDNPGDVRSEDGEEAAMISDRGARPGYARPEDGEEAAKISDKGDEPGDVPPDDDDDEEATTMGGDERRLDDMDGEDVEDKMEFEETFVNLEDDASFGTQDPENEGGMGGTYGMLTQPRDSDDDTDEDDDAPEKGMDNNDVVKRKEIEAATSEDAPMIDAVTTVARDKSMSLSGLTEPTQSQNVLPKDKLPKFSAIESGAPGREESRSAGNASASTSEKPSDEMALASSHSVDGSSAYHGLTEEDDEIDERAPDNVAKERPLEGAGTVNEEAGVDSTLEVSANAESNCDRPQDEDKLDGAASGEGIDGKMEVDAHDDAHADPDPLAKNKAKDSSDNGQMDVDDAADACADARADANSLEPAENEPLDTSAKRPSEATHPEDEEIIEDANDGDVQNAKSTVEVGREQKVIDDVENEVEHPTNVEQDEEANDSASKQQGEPTALEAEDSNENSNEDAPPATGEEGKDPTATNDAEIETEHSSAGQRDGEEAGPESEGERVEGTGDTLVMTGSCGGGWSLYDGDTQTLPTGPSQVLLDASLTNLTAGDAAAVDSSCPRNAVANGVDDEREHSNEGSAGIEASKRKEDGLATESVREDGEKGEGENEGTAGGSKTAGEEAKDDLLTASFADDPYNKETQKLDTPAVEEDFVNELEQERTKEPAEASVNECIAEDRRQIDVRQNVASMDRMKHTPDDGSLPISYPNDHLESPAKKASRATLCDKMVEDDGDETEMSQDLLSASPTKPDRHDSTEKSSDDPPRAVANGDILNDRGISSPSEMQPEKECNSRVQMQTHIEGNGSKTALPAAKMTEATRQEDQISMPNNAENQRTQNDIDQNAKTQALNKQTATNSAALSCETCGSTEDCEEDVDNPGDYYCKSCWAKYDSAPEIQEDAKMAAEKAANGREDLALPTAKMTDTTCQEDQINMPSNAENQRTQNDIDQNAKTQALNNRSNNSKQTTPHDAAPSCETCGSIENCEEDAFNPGDYYCKSCWKNYDSALGSQGEVKMAAGKTAKDREDLALPTTKMMTEATPREGQINTPNNAENQRPQNNIDQNAKTQALNNCRNNNKQMATHSAAPSCETCGSIEDCEEDVDNPGDYYCKSCWKNYDSALGSQEEVKMAAGKTANAQGDFGGDGMALEHNNGPTNAEKSTPKLPLQKKSDDGTKWMSSARHSHGNQDDKNCDSTSPRLLMPSFEPIRENAKDDGPAKPPSSKNNAADGSDNECWIPSRHNYDDSDSIIEDTQDDSEVERPSAFKRLSRGTSRSSVHDDSPSSKFSCGPHSNERKARSSDSSGTKRAIKPKVLRYEAVTKSGDTSSSSRATESSSEAEFGDDDIEDADHFQQSQTDLGIIEQLREVKALALKLPSGKEMNEIASRKQLADEIDELKKSHNAEINKLKRENSKLMAELKRAEETIKQKDQIIRKRDETIKQKKQVSAQLVVEMAEIRETLTGVASRTGKAKGVANLNGLPHTEHTTPAKTTKKRKKVDEKRLDSDSDSEEDDGEDDKLPLSALKNDQASSTHKRRRKPYGSRQANVSAKIAAKKTPAKKTGRMSPKAASVSNRSDDTSSTDTTPISNQSLAKKHKKHNILSPEIWKKLQEKGWEYKTGPEPYNKVYVPENGATHPGTQLGIHFFNCDQVIDEAIKRGDLVGNGSHENSMQLPAKHHRSPPRRTTPGRDLPAVSKSSEPGHDNPMDDSELCGKLLTLESAQFAINAVAKFARRDDRFKASLFQMLWDRLQDQGAGSGLNWRYEQYRDSLSSRNWCFVPPSSTLGAKGDLGKDYFLSEEQFVLCVLQEVSAIKQMRQLLKEHQESFSMVMPILTRAVERDMEYKDAKLGKSTSVRTARLKVRSTFQPGQDSSPKSSASKGKQQSSSKKRASKITPESKVDSGSSKKQKTTKQPDEHTSPSFHISQTQGVEVTRSTYNRRSPVQSNGPLSGKTFFWSGIDRNFLIDKKIERLGGRPIQPNALTVKKANKNTFFLADYTSWRKMKYIYAAALGVPMLHYQWLAELEETFQENGEVNVFDSRLYIKYRLPVGLNISRGIYPLQRASNARSWDPPGYTRGEGNTIFHGMKIALVTNNPMEGIDWKMILKACGATVKTLSDSQKGKGKINVDCCLFTSTSLPPHVVSSPAEVSNFMRFIGDDVPLLDLAWAHQSIIQRKRLPLSGDQRYSVSFDHGMSNTCHVFAIKRGKHGNRYEVGDLVQFSRVPKTILHGRIVAINLEKQGKGCNLEIQLLEPNGDFNLVDCPSSAKITVKEGNLQGNILMLGTRDFHKLGYLPKNSRKSNIFNQMVPFNESQMM